MQSAVTTRSPAYNSNSRCAADGAWKISSSQFSISKISSPWKRGPTATMMMAEHEKLLSDRYGTFEGHEDNQEQELVDSTGLQTPRQHGSARRGVLVLAAIVLVGAVGVLLGTSQPHLITTSKSTMSVSDEVDPSNPPHSPAVNKVEVFVDDLGDVTVVHGEPVDSDLKPDAWGAFNDSLADIGWSQLWIHTADLTKEELEDKAVAKRRRREIMYAAGYAEGQLTHHRIDQQFLNVYRLFFPRGDEADQLVEKGVYAFFQQNLEWIRHQIRHHDLYGELEDTEYWDTLSLILAQFDGLVAGYQHASVAQPPPVRELDFVLMNSEGDMEDLVNIVKQKADPKMLKMDAATADFYMFIKNLKCSALVRILPGASDVVWGHDTWNAFSSMNRIFKHYDVLLPAEDHAVAVKRQISMSSSPGYLSSVDDWYMTSAGLGVMETTNGVFDTKLYERVTPQSVPCWLRSKVANFLATDGRSWADTFAKYNSGTYNNQWMIVDSSKFVKGEGFLSGGLTVLEQLPDLIHVEDLSELINKQGYWASYNVPYFSDVYERSGFAQKYEASNRSKSWSHEDCARAQIFRRDAPTIESLVDFKRVMRSNNWQTDPLSEGHASHAIASRFDLETDPALVSLFGATDSKVTSLELIKQLECDAVAGPTHENNPVFEWTPENAALASHEGHPARFDFDYIRMKHSRDD